LFLVDQDSMAPWPGSGDPRRPLDQACRTAQCALGEDAAAAAPPVLPPWAWTRASAGPRAPG